MQKSVDLLYIGNNRLPSEKADGLYVMKLCEAFAKEGARVTLLVPKRVNPLREDPFSYYGIKKNFSIRAVSSFDLLFFSSAPLPLMKLFFLIQAATFGIAAAFFAKQWVVSGAGQKIIISHEPYSLFVLSFFARASGAAPIAFDLHVGAKQNFFWRRVCGVVTHFFVLTRGVAETLKIFGARVSVTISPDAVDLELFGRDCERHDARKRLGLPPNSFLCVYAGHLYAWKGINTILDAAQFIPQDVIIYCVGGTDQEITKHSSSQIFRRKNLGWQESQITKQGSHNVIFAGRKPHTEVPRWLCAADVLLLPNSGKEAISRLYTSPMKMFEYMASGKPIVASRLPSLMEVLNDANAVLVDADNPRALANGIMQLKNDSAYATRLAGQAKKDVARYSWKEKARNMMNTLIS
jgi:glycosyltransferase involved in cell wall biosynthesis